MNYYDACFILDLTTPFNNKELKHNYYVKALQYHPDKNSTDEAKNKFQEALAAYQYLINYKNIFEENKIDIEESGEIENGYTNILEQFINMMLDKKLDSQFLSILNDKYAEISLELLKHLPKTTLLKLHEFVDHYGDILHINSDIIIKLNEIIKEYTKNDTIINLNPSLENLINDEIYMLKVKGETYYIPLWHHELIYEISNNLLIVRCEPEIPEYITLDDYNNLYVNLSMTLESIQSNATLNINILKKSYVIPIEKLYIKKYQRYTLKNLGIALINTNDIYNVEKRGNIYIDIHFTDINTNEIVEIK